MSIFLKSIISACAYYLRLWKLFTRLCYVIERKPIVAVFTFHRILSERPDPDFIQRYERGQPLDLYERQIDVIRRYFTIIDLEKFYDIVTGKVDPKENKPLALLTYDDADSDHTCLAFPKLIRHGFPGVSFVPTAYIDSSKRFYHLRLTNICNNLTEENWQKIYAGELPDDVNRVLLEYKDGFADHKREIRRKLTDLFANMKPKLRDKIIDNWESHTNVEYNLGIKCMTWEEVKALPTYNISVGSHTVNHNKLALLDKETIVAEVTESKAMLEKEIGQPVDSISYPEGSYNDTVIEATRKAGYKMGFTVRNKLVDYPMKDSEFYRIPRIGAGTGSDHQICYPFGVMILKRLVKLISQRIATNS